MSDKKPNKKQTSSSSKESSDEEQTDLVSDIPSDDDSACGPPPPEIESPQIAEGAAAEGVAGPSKPTTIYGWIKGKLIPGNQSTEKAAKEKSPDKKEKTDSNIFDRIANKIKKLSPKKRTMPDKSEPGRKSAAKMSKYESAKLHGGFPQTKGELVLDVVSESSGVPTECTSLEASMDTNEERDYEKHNSPHKSPSSEESSDEEDDTLSESKK